MALSRLHTWIAGEVLTASDLNGEFNNIVVYVNALSFNALLAEGTLTAPSLAFASDTDTGFLHIRDGAFAAVSNGATIFIASAFFQASAFLFPVKTATEAVRTDMPGRAYWQSAESSLHIHTGTLIARVPALTGVQAGDLIIASNPTGVSGATAYARLPIATNGMVLQLVSSLPAWANPPVSASGTARFSFNSATQCQLGVGVIPLKVSGLWLNRSITAAVTIDTTGLSTNTKYYCYANDSAGSTVLTFSTTGHSADPLYGVEVQTGDSTKTLVGFVFVNNSTQFSDAAATRFVASWFSRRPRVAYNKTTTAPTTTSITYVEAEVASRIQFITWGDVDQQFQAGGGDIANSSVNGFIFAAVGVGTGTVWNQTLPGAGGGQDLSAGGRGFYTCHGATSFAEGTGYATLMWRVNTGTGTLSAAADPESSSIHTQLWI